MKPILFKTDMVRAILDGRKTQTRRVLKPQPKGTPRYNNLRYHWYDHYFSPGLPFVNDVTPMPRQPFRVGDILWVRETWLEAEGTCHYRADTTSEIQRCLVDDGHRWKPSIHMHREAARLFLRVTDVRAERVQDITIKDCIAEGVSVGSMNWNRLAAQHKEKYRELWESINTKRKYDGDYVARRPGCNWDANPWVWVYTFEKLDIERGASV
ncbi:hypothetical protein FACS18949_11900 [Clostridia bacterium]|nr:hypothetical protein FACS18949_11900 [Clostridia bacterium]